MSCPSVFQFLGSHANLCKDRCRRPAPLPWQSILLAPPGWPPSARHPQHHHLCIIMQTFLFYIYCDNDYLLYIIMASYTVNCNRVKNYYNGRTLQAKTLFWVCLSFFGFWSVLSNYLKGNIQKTLFVPFIARYLFVNRFQLQYIFLKAVFSNEFFLHTLSHKSPLQ